MAGREANGSDFDFGTRNTEYRQGPCAHHYAIAACEAIYDYWCDPPRLLNGFEIGPELELASGIRSERDWAKHAIPNILAISVDEAADVAAAAARKMTDGPTAPDFAQRAVNHWLDGPFDRWISAKGDKLPERVRDGLKAISSELGSMLFHGGLAHIQQRIAAKILYASMPPRKGRPRNATQHVERSIFKANGLLNGGYDDWTVQYDPLRMMRRALIEGLDRCLQDAADSLPAINPYVQQELFVHWDFVRADLNVAAWHFLAMSDCRDELRQRIVVPSPFQQAVHDSSNTAGEGCKAAACALEHWLVKVPLMHGFIDHGYKEIMTSIGGPMGLSDA